MVLGLAIIGDILQFVAGNIGAIFGGVASAALAVVGWLGARFLAPLLKTSQRKQYAEWIAVIADEATDALVARYPNQIWLQHVNEAVDQLAEVCGITLTVSERAVDAAIRRKGQKRILRSH